MLLTSIGSERGTAHLSLSQNQSEDGVRPGALVIHACGCSGSLFIAQL